MTDTPQPREEHDGDVPSDAAEQNLKAHALHNEPGYALQLAQTDDAPDEVVEAQGVDPAVVETTLVPEDDAPDVDATPAAQDEADKADVDLADVEGTGKDGRVTKADVEDAEKSE